MSSFSGIKNTLLAEQVEEQLYEYITKLPMKAGDKLPNEFKLAEMFGVGRSTVREAVKLLVSRNVLETRRGSGTYVKDLVPTDLDPLNLRNVEDKVTLAMNLVDLRLILEPGIAELAAYNATDEEIEAACKKASVHDFIMTLPKGYDTPVGELGDTLSGGERQRLGLARAFLHDAPFMLLDEPTSNLDSLNEAVILKSLREERAGKTVVLVSHRQSTMRIADTVYSVEHGRMS